MLPAAQTLQDPAKISWGHRLLLYIEALKDGQYSIPPTYRDAASRQELKTQLPASPLLLAGTGLGPNFEYD